MSQKPVLETRFERGLFAARWLMAPMYLGLVALYVAAALWLNSWWALVLLPVVVIVIDRTVIAREERYLGSAFPSEYSAYRSRVRRWL